MNRTYDDTMFIDTFEHEYTWLNGFMRNVRRLSKRPAVIKKVYDISFDIPNRTPLNCRENPAFSKYFDCIWKELNANE